MNGGPTHSNAEAPPGSYDSGDEYELRHYLNVLRRRKFYVIVPTLVLAVAGYAFAKVERPSFQSTAEVIVQPVSPADASDASSTRTRPGDRTEVATEVAILGSAEVRDEVEKRLGRPVDVSVAPVSDDASVAAIRASSRNRRKAQEDAQKYAETYIELRQAQLADRMTKATTQLQADLTALDGQIAGYGPLLNDLDARIIAAYDAVVRNGLENQRDELLAQRSTLQDRRSALQDQLSRLQLSSSVNPTFGIDKLSNASEPDKGGARKRRYALAGAAVGFVLGLVLAFAREHFDDTLKTRRDLEVATGGAPTLGLIPRARRWSTSVLVAGSRRDMPTAESYNKLRTSFELARRQTDVRTVMVTSPNAGEGKTATVANLAVALASLGRRVLLLDANLHSPRLHDLFQLRNDSGLTTLLSAKTTLDQTAQSVAGTPGLEVVTAGPPHPDPAALLSSDAARRVVTAAASDYDVVLFDGPPLLPVTDGLLLASVVEGVIVVARLLHTPCDDVAESMELLDRTSTTLLGTVLRDVDHRTAHVTRYGDRRDAYAGPVRTNVTANVTADGAGDVTADVTADKTPSDLDAAPDGDGAGNGAGDGVTVTTRRVVVPHGDDVDARLEPTSEPRVEVPLERSERFDG
jgi:capsular exopolysaccharide synthesis family protein